MNSREELLVLLDLLAQAVNVVRVSSIADREERERKIVAHNLANRFFQYGMSVLHLSDETNVEALPSFGEIRVIDPASIDVVTRAAMEAALVFHWLFGTPASEDEREFRYWAYKAVGLAERQNLPVGILAHAQQKADERKALKGLHHRLESNAVFRSLTLKQKRGLLEGRQRDLWRWRHDAKKTMSWSEIATDTGLSEVLASHMYRHLSSHAHSGSLSVLQTQQAVVRKEAGHLVRTSLDVVKILTANMIHKYTGLFGEARHVLAESGASAFVDTWIRIGQRLDENLGTHE